MCRVIEITPSTWTYNRKFIVVLLRKFSDAIFLVPGSSLGRWLGSWRGGGDCILIPFILSFLEQGKLMIQEKHWKTIDTATSQEEEEE